MAQRISLWEKAFCEGFVDENHFGRGPRVAVRNIAAAENGNAESVAEVGPDVVRAHAHAWGKKLLGLHAVDGPNAIPAPAGTQAVRDERCGLNPGSFTQAGKQILIKMLLFLVAVNGEGIRAEHEKPIHAKAQRQGLIVA